MELLAWLFAIADTVPVVLLCAFVFAVGLWVGVLMDLVRVYRRTRIRTMRMLWNHIEDLNRHQVRSNVHLQLLTDRELKHIYTEPMRKKWLDDDDMASAILADKTHELRKTLPFEVIG